ncbi:lytic transglycosylase domain-containing protein [Flavitalea flava]
MFKTQVPIYFCSLLFIIAMPTEANPVQPSFEAGKNNSYYTAEKARLSATKKKKIVFYLPGKPGMKFINAYIKNNDESLLSIKQRSEVPFFIIDSVFDRYHLPQELKYLAVIESELKTSATSRVGAKGPWQLMAGTAHALGLKTTRRSDDRLNYYKSTRAAAKYLRDLHNTYGDWLLVLAAYNSGPVPVNRAIQKAHSKSFWAIQRYLPEETRLHVKRFIATAYYFEQAEQARQAKLANQVAEQSKAEQSKMDPAKGDLSSIF